MRMVCVHCDAAVRATDDDVAPFVHEASGNAFCDVMCAEDAVVNAATFPARERFEADPYWIAS